MIPASGQWQSAAQAPIVRESSRILRILHQSDDASDAQLDAIARAYALRFHQDSVLRIDRDVSVTFE